MGLVGGSVAFWHFPRTSAPHPMPLPDYGYDLIPEYCPLISISVMGHATKKQNMQSTILLVFYTWFLLLLLGFAVQTRNLRKSKHMLQQLLHLNALVFVTRTTTVTLTGLPQPNPRCVDVQHFHTTYKESVHFVMGRGFPPHACGDLIYSGHVACLLCCMVLFHRYPPFKQKNTYFHFHLVYLINLIYYGILWTMTMVGVYFVLSCRSHYSVDVVLAFYFTYFLQDWYYVRSQARIPVAREYDSYAWGWFSATRIIQWLEHTSPMDDDGVDDTPKHHSQQQQQQQQHVRDDSNSEWKPIL